MEVRMLRGSSSARTLLHSTTFKLLFCYLTTTLLLNVHLHTVTGHQVLSSQPLKTAAAIRQDQQDYSLPKRILNNETTNEVLSSTFSVASTFLSQLESYQRDQYYASYSRLLASPEIRQLAQSEDDQQCLEMLTFALKHPLGYRWTAKCKSKKNMCT